MNNTAAKIEKPQALILAVLGADPSFAQKNRDDQERFPTPEELRNYRSKKEAREPHTNIFRVQPAD